MSRAETGAMQFGDDWPGVFIRGDEACWLCHQIRYLLDHGLGARHNMAPVLNRLVRTLERCYWPEIVEVTNRLKPFEECCATPVKKGESEP